MKRLIVIIGFSFAFAGLWAAAKAEPSFDSCLIMNMAAVHMLEEDIDQTQELLTRARLTEDAYAATQASLEKDRIMVENLLDQRAAMLSDETLDADEQNARNAVIMRSYGPGYGPGADAEIENFKASGGSIRDYAKRAENCAP